MNKTMVLPLLWFSVLYVFANAAFALADPQGWIKARWTAKRSIHRDSDPWSNGDIRGVGVFFALVGLALAALSVKVTIAFLR
jgi:hypothetical protein